MLAMFHSLFLFASLVAFTSASPLQTRGRPHTLPMTKYRSSTPVPAGNRGRARAAEFLAGMYGKHCRDTSGSCATSSFAADTGSVGVANVLDTYTMTVNIGNPPTTYNLLIDTGSSNTWIGANTSYNPTSTSQSTGEIVSVSYGSGNFTGEEYIDQIDLGGGFVITEQSIGVASQAQGFDGVDGILGIGPVDLTEDTVDGANEEPTVTDNLFDQGSIQQEIIGIYYAPTAQNGAVNGELTFGGVDTSKLTSDITYVPLTTTSPASQYWGINQTVSYSGQQILNSSGIVDTGTTLVLLATDAFDIYKNAIPGSKVDESSGLLQIPQASLSSVQSLVYNIGGTDFEFTAKNQLLDQSLNRFYGGKADAYYSVVSDLGSPSGQGLDFINGYLFLEAFYSVYDTTNGRVGFATTANS